MNSICRATDRADGVEVEFEDLGPVDPPVGFIVRLSDGIYVQVQESEECTGCVFSGNCRRHDREHLKCMSYSRTDGKCVKYKATDVAIQEDDNMSVCFRGIKLEDWMLVTRKLHSGEEDTPGLIFLKLDPNKGETVCVHGIQRTRTASLGDAVSISSGYAEYAASGYAYLSDNWTGLYKLRDLTGRDPFSSLKDVFNGDFKDWVTLWETDAPKEMTVAQIEEKLGYKIKVVAEKGNKDA